MLSDYDILEITETWLDGNIMDNELFPDGYIVFRYDRQNRRGGGTLLAIKDCYAVTMNNVSTNCDNVFDRKIIEVVYIPPGISSILYQNICNDTENAFCESSDYLILLGDFNLAKLYNDNVLNNRNFSIRENCIIYMSSLLGLSQCNCTVNVFNGTLDLVFSNFDCDRVKVLKSIDVIVEEDNYHPALNIYFTVIRTLREVV